MLEPAAMYIEPKRPLEGGELDLGEFGYCDLGGILEPWIAALTRSPTPKNKHLIVIVDSICSGRFVEDLQKLASKEGPWNQNGCGVTVQSACGSDEVNFARNFVGYFTPCFVHFNKPENRDTLQDLKREWNSKNEIKKIVCRYDRDLPSPEAATTMPLDKLSSTIDCPTVEFQDLPGLTLFQDAGFFKFCFDHFCN
ncbi:uncharacterized protein LOC114516607 [Dendronephthya gigantea]|uniref:uncharacterized protein LOC114516607 n=1 Tax=Dendronephthya gigantea TaxID=151771 RepID=UPI00106AC3D0|nr:uncharacterized protein LOC114516607 [Dendronephthya gigantea]